MSSVNLLIPGISYQKLSKKFRRQNTPAFINWYPSIENIRIMSIVSYLIGGFVQLTMLAESNVETGTWLSKDDRYRTKYSGSSLLELSSWKVKSIHRVILIFNSLAGIIDITPIIARHFCRWVIELYKFFSKFGTSDLYYPHGIHFGIFFFCDSMPHTE